MALTKPRASQIYDIDYKQATRVITTANINLTGGAPNQVDGVNLSLNDRVLVIGQSTSSQNGIYFVDVLGTGSNGTWVRTGDTDLTGELLAGTIVMVTEGVIYADTQWKLTSDNPIVIGTTALTFEQNSAFAFGNIYANNTAVLATSVGDSLVLTAGNNIQITGNNTSKSVTIGVTGISLTSIANGTSNVNVVSSGGNVTVGVAGTSNVAVFSSSGSNITGILGVSGNVTGGNIATEGELKSTGTFLIGTQAFYPQGSDGFSVNENFNAGNSTVTAYHYTSGAGRDAIVFDTAVTGQFTTGFGTTGSAASNKFVLFAEYGNTVWEWRKNVGIQAPNLNGGTLLANISADGNFYTLGTIAATGNISGANVNGGNLSLTGNVVSALNVTGNITGGNILGNGSQLTGINAFSNITVTGGNSAVADSIADTLTLTAGSGISLVMDTSTDTLTIAASGGSEIFVDGADFGTVTEPVTLSDDLGLVTAAVDSEADLGTIVTSGVFYPDLLVIESPSNFLFFGGNNGQYLGTTGNGVLQWQSLSSAPLAGTMVGNIDGNTFSINNLTSLGATGNVTGGNLVTAGQVTATGNVTGGNLVTAGQVTATGNITGGNLVTVGRVTATGNITGSFIFGNGSQLTGIDATGIQSGTSNIRVISSGGNVATGIGGTSNVVIVATTGQFVTGLISATGNVTGGNLVTAGNTTISTSLAVGATTPSGTAGEIRATNAITAFYSDRRLKTNIQQIQHALDKVEQLSGVVYTQNKLAETFGYNDYSQQVGVFAQDVKEVQPEAVKLAPFDLDENGQSKSGENYLTVQYEKLVPLLIESIKELRKEINLIKKQLDSTDNNNANNS
jgi:hypothetical protein